MIQRMGVKRFILSILVESISLIVLLCSELIQEVKLMIEDWRLLSLCCGADVSDYL